MVVFRIKSRMMVGVVAAAEMINGIVVATESMDVLARSAV